jgi:hypothetical protein
MPGPPVRQNRSGEPAVDRAQRERDTDQSPLLACPLLRGVAVTGVEFSPGENRVIHKLGRTPAGYLLTRWREGPPDFTEVSLDDKVAVFDSDVTATFDFWFY